MRDASFSIAQLRSFIATAEAGNLTRACTVEQLRKIKNFDTAGLMAPLSFDNPKQLAGTAVKVYQLDLPTKTFKSLVGFEQY